MKNVIVTERKAFEVLDKPTIRANYHTFINATTSTLRRAMTKTMYIAIGRTF